MSVPAVPCPFCESRNTDLFSLFGSSALTSQYHCRDCRTVFEQVKWGADLPGDVSSLQREPERRHGATAGRPQRAGGSRDDR